MELGVQLFYLKYAPHDAVMTLLLKRSRTNIAFFRKLRKFVFCTIESYLASFGKDERLKNAGLLLA